MLKIVRLWQMYFYQTVGKFKPMHIFSREEGGKKTNTKKPEKTHTCKK